MKHTTVDLSRLLAALLCLALLLGLTACGQKAPQYEAQPGVQYTRLMDAVNRELATPLSSQINQVDWWGIVDGQLMAYGGFRQPDDPDNPESRRDDLLVEVGIEDGGFNCVQLALPQPPEDLKALQTARADEAAGKSLTDETGELHPMRTFLGAVTAADSTVYLLVDDALYHYRIQNGGTVARVLERAVTLCNLAADGTAQPLARLALPKEAAALPALADTLFVDGGDGLWLSAVDYAGESCTFLRFSLTDGQLLSQLSLPQGLTLWGDCAGPIEGDRLLVLPRAVKENGAVSQQDAALYIAEGISTDAPRWNDPLPCPAGLESTYVDGIVAQLTGPQGEVLLRTGQGIYAWQPQDNTVQCRAAWLDFGIDAGKLRQAYGLGDGRYLAICRQEENLSAPYALRLLTPLDPSVLAGRKVLTFGGTPYGLFGPGVTPDLVQQTIAAFNATSTEYYIEYIDYARRGWERTGEWMDFFTIFQEDILSGEVPDILMTNVYPALLLQKGLLIDLAPYLDSDSELSRGDFVPAVLNANIQGDTLPMITPAFSVLTLTAGTDLAGDGGDWSLQKLADLLESHPDASPCWRGLNPYMLSNLIGNAPGAFIDWQTRQAHFDSPTFVRLLKASAGWPTEAQWDWNDNNPTPAIQSGKALLLQERYDEWRKLLGPRFIWGDDFAFLGFPGSEGGSHIICSDLQLGISSTCRDPDAAWQLVRQFLLPAFQDQLGIDSLRSPGFPVRLDSLRSSAAFMTAPEDTYVHYSYFPQAEAGAYWRQGVPAALSDRFIALLDTAVPSAADGTVSDIIAEEADAFYNGVRSAEEAAAIIQNRVQTYLDEQG